MNHLAKVFGACCVGILFLFSQITAAGVISKEEYRKRLLEEKPVQKKMCSGDALLVNCMADSKTGKGYDAKACESDITTDLEQSLKLPDKNSATECMLYHQMQTNLADYHQEFWINKISNTYVQALIKQGYAIKQQDANCVQKLIPILKAR